MLVRRPIRNGFTITELLVVIGVIIVLLGILLPALATMRSQGSLADSENNLRQVGIWMRSYSTENREYIVPSQFNYSANPYPGHVRDEPNVKVGAPNTGTWTDILWTVYGNHSFKQVADAPVAIGIGGSIGHDYSKDSPDVHFYTFYPDFSDNPFRSAAQNTKPASGTGPTPFGSGAYEDEDGQPGYFAANNFFNADPTSPSYNGWYVTGQIRSPERSMYAVDSFYGETIETNTPDPWKNVPNSIQVDFRYSDSCIMLYLDGSVRPQGVWDDIFTLQDKRQVKLTDLTN